MRKRGLTQVVVLAFLLAATCVAASRRDADDGPIIRTSRAAMVAQSGSARPLTLIGSSFLDAESDLIPADINVAQRLETPTLLKISVPKQPARNALFVCISGTHQYEQVPSSAPLVFSGRYRLHFNNAALPSEFVLSFGMDGLQESHVSAVNVLRDYDPAPCGVIDATILVPFLQDTFGISAAESAQLARAVISGETTISLTVVARIQSVSAFNLFNAALDVFGN